jgi:hypothetical protein
MEDSEQRHARNPPERGRPDGARASGIARGEHRAPLFEASVGCEVSIKRVDVNLQECMRYSGLRASTFPVPESKTWRPSPRKPPEEVVRYRTNRFPIPTKYPRVWPYGGRPLTDLKRPPNWPCVCTRWNLPSLGTRVS